MANIMTPIHVGSTIARILFPALPTAISYLWKQVDHGALKMTFKNEIIFYGDHNAITCAYELLGSLVDSFRTSRFSMGTTEIL
jgi:hypothetical protein